MKLSLIQTVLIAALSVLAGVQGVANDFGRSRRPRATFVIQGFNK